MRATTSARLSERSDREGLDRAREVAANAKRLVVGAKVSDRAFFDAGAAEIEAFREGYLAVRPSSIPPEFATFPTYDAQRNNFPDTSVLDGALEAAQAAFAERTTALEVELASLRRETFAVFDQEISNAIGAGERERIQRARLMPMTSTSGGTDE